MVEPTATNNKKDDLMIIQFNYNDRAGNPYNMFLPLSTGRALHRIIKRVTLFGDKDSVLNLSCHRTGQNLTVRAGTLNSPSIRLVANWITKANMSYMASSEFIDKFAELLGQLRELRTDRKLFIDMDGVAADFDAFFVAEYGMHFLHHSKEAMWDAIGSHEAFYRALPPYPLFQEFYGAVAHLKPTFLTSTREPRFGNDKRLWLRDTIGHHGEFNLICVAPCSAGQFDKAVYAQDGSILIDDYPHNTDQWAAAGGVGIEHECFVDTAQSLIRLIHNDTHPN